MELVTKFVNTPFANFIPVVFIVVLATLVYAFGFKSPEQPQFDKLSAYDDRKSAPKKRKLKEKKTANGHAIPISESKSEKLKDSKRSPAKEAPDTPKKSKKQDLSKQVDSKKQEPPAKLKKTESNPDEAKVKKGKIKYEKPADYDDGDWETVPGKNDKKKKVDSPIKKEKKNNKAQIETKEKALEKNADIQKFIKAEVDKQLKENDKENKPIDNIKKTEEIEVEQTPHKELSEEAPQIEETKSKKEKKPKKKTAASVEVIDTPPEIPAKVELENIEVNEEIQVEDPAPENKSGAGAAVFDELGDVWTEAKAVKKSKKKSRRD